MKIENGEIKIDPQEIVDSLTSTEKTEMLKYYMVCDDVIESVIAWMCDEDTDGWWSSGSHKLREKLLKKIEDCHLAKMARFNWSSLDTAIPKIKKIRSEEHLYWKLYHTEESWNMTVSDWLRTHGEGLCEHTTEIADTEIAEIIESLKAELSNLNQPLKQ